MIQRDNMEEEEKLLGREFSSWINSIFVVVWSVDMAACSVAACSDSIYRGYAVRAIITTGKRKEVRQTHGNGT
jgi:hypothetical protein